MPQAAAVPLPCPPMRAAACVVVLGLALAACGGGKSPSGEATSTGRVVDVKAACATLDGLHRAADALRGVDVSDPDASEAALARAIGVYRASLLRFEQAGPASLRAPAEVVRADVAARQFARATTARAAIDAWAASHCN
jgi:hypothetical protein